MMDLELSTPILDRVKVPADMRGLDMAELRALADDVRTEMIHTVGQTGGHLGSGLGVVELTVALH
jgi:1-deoxy-D-xylulose-5-phosphate synthase